MPPRRAPSAYGGSSNDSYRDSVFGCSDNSRAPSVISNSEMSSMMGDGGLSSVFSTLLLGGQAVPPTMPTETEIQRQAREAKQQQTKRLMHIQDHMRLPPFAINGDALLDAHELGGAAQARLIRTADFQRQSEEARLAYNNDPARTWSRYPNCRYPEEILGSMFSIPTPIIGHPVVPGPGTYHTGIPGAVRTWMNTNDSTTAKMVYHSLEEGKRRHRKKQESARQEEQNCTAKLAQLNSQLLGERRPVQRRLLQLDIRKTEAKRENWRQRAAAQQNIHRQPPFTEAALIPQDPQCAPLVSNLANPFTRKYDQEQNSQVLECSQCGGRALINSEGEVLQRCWCPF